MTEDIRPKTKTRNERLGRYLRPLASHSDIQTQLCPMRLLVLLPLIPFRVSGRFVPPVILLATLPFLLSVFLVVLVVTSEQLVHEPAEA